MRPLGWTKNSRTIRNRTSGFLALFLILLMFSFLKTAFTSSLSGPQMLPCGRKVFVHVEGDVRFPGVYAFCHRPNGPELVERASGLQNDGVLPQSFKDLTFPTGARVVIRDIQGECKVYRDEMSAFHKVALDIPISLNTESEGGLTAIPGIGPELAKAIVLERARRGGFKQIDEIKFVSRIGEKLFRRIRPYLRL
jgi:competence protein ComEA